ncbi:MAG: N-acetyltransferase [Asticcacaulis sp.]
MSEVATALSGAAMDTYRFERLITVETPDDRAVADALVNRVFGPGRYVKTAERLREGNTPLADLCFVMRLNPASNSEGVAGSVRLWPVRVYDDTHHVKGELAFLGPIAVDPEHQSHGIGRTLIEVAIKAAFDSGVTGILLVGTPSYFERFGFAKAQGLSLPGPVDYRRVMVLYNPAYTGDPLQGAVGI